MKPLYWKILLILGAVIVAASLILPKALRKSAQADLDDIPHTELILEVDEEYLLQKMLRSEVDELHKEFSAAKIRGTIRDKDGAIVVGFRSDEFNEKGVLFLENYPVDFDNTDKKNIIVEKIKNRLYKLLYTQAYIDYKILDSTKQTYRAISTYIEAQKANYLDIKLLADNQIRLRVVDDNEDKFLQLMRQIRSSDQLSFHEVMVLPASATGIDDCLEGIRCPLGAMALPQKNGSGYMIVREREIVSNFDIKKASAGLHPNTNHSVVNFIFNARGAKKFCDFTANHIGEPFAVVLNDEIITAPIINGAICGGSGFIEGGFTMETAENLALSLNAGTLPTKMRVVKERVVVPPGTAETQK